MQLYFIATKGTSGMKNVKIVGLFHKWCMFNKENLLNTTSEIEMERSKREMHFLF